MERDYDYEAAISPRTARRWWRSAARDGARAVERMGARRPKTGAYRGCDERHLYPR